MSKRVILYSYYSPEEITGIGKFNGEMINYFLDQGYHVTNLSSVPFYPYWKVYEGHKNSLFSKSSQGDFLDLRSWVYIPKRPGSLKKILSELTFFFSSIISWFRCRKQLAKADLIIVVKPPFFLGVAAILLNIVFRKRLLFHIQDLQVDAAIDLKLLPQFLNKFLLFIEKAILKRADKISTISEGMTKKLVNKGISDQDILMVRNWANLDTIHPMTRQTWLHKRLGIEEDKKLIVYSGNIGEKQGLELILDVAERLKTNSDLHFVILGEGIFKEKLLQLSEAKKLSNMTFDSLVEFRDLNLMLNSSFLQLVIQKSEGADSFLPSKLNNILAAGCCTIVTANNQTSLYNILVPNQAAKVIAPDSSAEIETAILQLSSDPEQCEKIRINARKLAENELGIDRCMKALKNYI